MLDKLREALRPEQAEIPGVSVQLPYWVRWTYSEEEWKRFDRLDWNRTRRHFYSKIFILALAIPWSAFLIRNGNFNWRLQEIPLWWLPLMGLVAVIAVWFWWSLLNNGWQVYRAGRKRHTQRQNPGMERVLEIGPIDICQSGNCIPVSGPDLRLYEVSIGIWDPTILRFRMYSCPAPATFRPWIPTGIDIPIPEGQEESANELVERFRREFRRE